MDCVHGLAAHTSVLLTWAIIWPPKNMAVYGGGSGETLNTLTQCGFSALHTPYKKYKIRPRGVKCRREFLRLLLDVFFSPVQTTHDTQHTSYPPPTVSNYRPGIVRGAPRSNFCTFLSSKASHLPSHFLTTPLHGGRDASGVFTPPPPPQPLAERALD